MMSSESKFKVGDVVTFHNGSYRIIDAVVKSVYTDYEGLPFSEPLYVIEWPPTGGVTVHERELSGAEAQMEYLTRPEREAFRIISNAGPKQLFWHKQTWIDTLMGLARARMTLEECENWFIAHLSLEPNDQSARMMLNMITPLVLR